MTLSLKQSYAWCKTLSRRRAGNFYFSFLTLPADRFRDMCALYAFMRICDDLGDDEHLSATIRAANLDAWHASLTRALDGESFDHELFPALAEMVHRTGIPREYLFAVIEGVRTDLQPVGFETFAELTDYCYHVAGAVGLCCIHIWGFHDDRATERAIDCGIAFQLTNILRDLAEDAAMGRLYLPREDLRRFGYSADDIVARCVDDRFLKLMQFEVARAETYYDRAAELLAYLDPPGRPIYAAMLNIYGGLLKGIKRRGYNVYAGRIKLSRLRKLAIALGAMLKYRWWPHRSRDET